jgi:hypothetical protein
VAWRRRRVGRRVVTPDGYVWFLRRRRARRRLPWARRPPGGGTRFHDEEELPADSLPGPGPVRIITDTAEHLDDLVYDAGTSAASVLLFLAAVVTGLGGLVWLTGAYVLPWLVPLVAANARPLAAAVAVLAVLVAADRLLGSWYVELQRQGLDDAPRWVWRVRGWRRSGRLIGELAAAIREGRIDQERGVILRTDGSR